MNKSSINLTNCFRVREHFDTIFFSFSYRLMLGATWLCLCFLMVNRVLGEEEVEMIPSGCCDWPSCYDTRTQVCHLTLIFLMIPLFKLCLDACQKVWIQCPSKLVLLSCYSRFLPTDFNRYNGFKFLPQNISSSGLCPPLAPCLSNASLTHCSTWT